MCERERETKQPSQLIQPKANWICVRGVVVADLINTGRQPDSTLLDSTFILLLFLFFFSFIVIVVAVAVAVVAIVVVAAVLYGQASSPSLSLSHSPTLPFSLPLSSTRLPESVCTGDNASNTQLNKSPIHFNISSVIPLLSSPLPSPLRSSDSGSTRYLIPTPFVLRLFTPRPPVSCILVSSYPRTPVPPSYLMYLPTYLPSPLLLFCCRSSSYLAPAILAWGPLCLLPLSSPPLNPNSKFYYRVTYMPCDIQHVPPIILLRPVQLMFPRTRQVPSVQLSP
ncbi:hypothetical protein F4775DRAFT_431851 [Biscogniauxia sp. FL1348]|nr:hypothetical protein F4775DRAFT_431851 [Biscogniauxia sp. FL1348]